MSPQRVEVREPDSEAKFSDAVHPLLQRIYAARQVRDDAELDQKLTALHDFKGLGGLEAAVALLTDCLEHDRRILIVGDFDCDGATSTALAVRGLRQLGASQVDYLVPNRFEYGYGLTPEIVTLARVREPFLIVTVDNGISSIAGVAAARAAGIRVLVTDHHLPGAQLPDADAIVNPNLPGDGFPSKALAGVGVMFYVLLALRAALRARGWFVARDIAEPNLAERLDLVALGTVADLVPLDHNNRVLVAQGLARLRAGRGVPGIHALLQVAGRDSTQLTSADLGFSVGPRLNAAGRLDDMSLGIECLLTEEATQAAALAARLDELNHERRAIEAEMREQALQTLEALQFDADTSGLPFGVCLFDERWHEGVVGLVAGRIRERTHRPAVAFARAQDGSLKGSARSIRGLHIRDTLEAVASCHPGLIVRFGGHAMAAGLSLAADGFEAFATAFDAEVRRRVSAQALTGVIETDGELSSEWLTLECAALLRDAGPWGQGFPEPSFHGIFRVLARRSVGAGHLKLTLAAQADAGSRLDAILFNAPAGLLPEDCATVRIVYRPEVNQFQGLERLQLRVDYLEPVVP